MIRRPAAAVTLLLFAACAADGGAAGNIAHGTTAIDGARRDSAGVTIVEFDAAAMMQAPQFSVDTTPIGIIGKGDSTLDLSRSYTAIVLHGDRVATVVDGAIVIFDPVTGRSERIGRRGQGPGEFQEPTLLNGGADTILVSDEGNSRISWVVPSKGVVRERRIPLIAPGITFGAAGSFSGDTILMIPTGHMFSMDNEPGIVTNPVGRLLASPDSIGIFMTVNGTEMKKSNNPSNPDLKVAMERYSPDAAITPWGAGVLASRGDKWQLDQYAVSGKHSFSVRVARSRTPMTDVLKQTDIDANIAETRKRIPPGSDTSLFANFRSYPYPDSLPAFSEAINATDGSIWVKDAHIRSDSTWGFTSFDGTGRLLGRVEGNGHAPWLVGATQMVFRDTDADGVVTLRVMRIKRDNP